MRIRRCRFTGEERAKPPWTRETAASVHHVQAGLADQHHRRRSSATYIYQKLVSTSATADPGSQADARPAVPSQYIPPPVDDESIWPPPEAAIPRRSTWDRFSQKFKEEPFVPIGPSRARSRALARPMLTVDRHRQASSQPCSRSAPQHPHCRRETVCSSTRCLGIALPRRALPLSLPLVSSRATRR